MAEATTKEGEPVPTEIINIKNANPEGDRGIHDAAGQLVILKPNAEPVDVEVPAPWAAKMREVSAGGSDYVVTGSEPVVPTDPSAPIDARTGKPKQLSREELNELERENLKAALGQQKTNTNQQRQGAQTSAKLSRQDMETMTKAELAEYAASLGVDVPSTANKAEIADAIVRKQRG